MAYTNEHCDWNINWMEGYSGSLAVTELGSVRSCHIRMESITSLLICRLKKQTTIMNLS